MKKTIAINLGGISNRVKCLISMWRLADLYGKELILYWPKNHTCGAEFKDLFENDFQEINKKQLENISGKYLQIFGEDSLTIKDSSKKYLVSGTWRFLLTPKELEKNSFLKEKRNFEENGIDFNLLDVPKEIKKEILNYLKKLRILKSLQKEIDNFQEKYNLKEMIGVHIRRGDFSDRPTSPGKVSSDKKFIEKMKELIKKNPKTKFFLCTDSKEIEKIIEKEFPNRISKYPKTSFVRTDVRATQEGLIDLLLLSKTKQILGTYRSTFTEMAWWFGKCKPKMEIIINPEKQKEYFKNVKQEKKRIIPKIKRIILILIGRKFYD